MKKRIGLLSILATTVFLLSGCAGVENKEGKFYSFFVKPMEGLLDFFSGQFNGSYGLAIIVITVLIRLVLMPFMLRNYKTQQEMKIKMDALRPEMEDIQKRLKEAKEAGDKEEQMKLQQEMMGLYQKHGVNPLNMGCLPLIIQMPIIMGLYFAILYSPEVKTHKFLWFNLGEPDMIMMLIAGAVYFVQARVSLWTMPEQQKQQMKMFIYLSPIMIMFISLKAVAALPLYWAVGGLLLIIQTYIGRKLYFKEVEPQPEAPATSAKDAPKKDSKSKKK
ncbi:membrane protein insertase YidC [Sporosarcina pasteurii]|uniref:Membrane protein insertase YidC n=1 Tax=Sporosarcina pasteurii TaxID=1474 RepID=A0A380CGH3_SPOPA|nr:membrane protein insertase YidC [Sporosarcina pasteurii]MDS9472159.1 membrane protein insertase YidC [Sporosarcina pasteurii]QBQ06871.1 membrane protein insertase YidC [Sporosarcina pasteurii]SUJ20315.1 Membrane protein YidC 1 [Sporosarcina pasteurii]